MKFSAPDIFELRAPVTHYGSQALDRVGDRHLEGELRADTEPTHRYRVFARDEAFLRHEGRIYRRNEIWRSRTDRRTGLTVDEERVKQNCALVTYTPIGVDIHDV